MTIKHTIKEQIDQVLKKEFNLTDIDYQIEYPPQAVLGDYSCNVAMALAKKLKQKPMDIGSKIAEHLKTGELFAEIKVEGAGFINFFLSEKILIQTVDRILKQKQKYGAHQADLKQKIQVEFISANPTGPLTLANGRGGFSGDVLANVLALAGHKVEREYYVNNFGNQIRLLGHSVLKDDQAQYKGEYIDELNKQLKNKKQDVFEIGLLAADKILNEYIKPVIDKMNIKFDHWFLERKMHESGQVDKMLEFLKQKDLVFTKDGAIWLKTTDQQNSDDDKDRVLVKSNGDKTYFLADIAYHFDKFEKRKFNKVINLWGADHHGYVARLKHAVALLGYPGQLEILLMQMVRLVKDGQEYKMSKRKGVYVLIEDLIDEVGLDATRFFFLMHANNKAMDFDLNLAKEKSNKNPVFYVQYAHARICSIIAKVKGAKICRDAIDSFSVQEKELIKQLIKWPELIDEVAGSYEVHKIAFYCTSLADKFHDFYENCRVIDNGQVIDERLKIIQATRQVLENSLNCLGVSSPEKM